MSKRNGQPVCEYELTVRKQEFFRNVLIRSIRKWTELKNSENCSPKCREFNQSQIDQLNELGKFLMSLPTTEGKESLKLDVQF